MTGRTRRSLKSKKDDDFVYQKVGKTSASTKRQLKQAKQTEMRNRPDTLFCDLGEEWRRIEEVNDSKVYDVQMFTTKVNEWRIRIEIYI